jgi:hypothetical protein
MRSSVLLPSLVLSAAALADVTKTVTATQTRYAAAFVSSTAAASQATDILSSLSIDLSAALFGTSSSSSSSDSKPNSKTDSKTDSKSDRTRSTDTLTRTRTRSSASGTAMSGTAISGTGNLATRTRSGGAKVTTVSLFNACDSSENAGCGQAEITYYGSVVSARVDQTVYAVDCAQSGNSTVCQGTPVTVTQGPSLFARVEALSGSVAALTTVAADNSTLTTAAAQKGGNKAVATATLSLSCDISLEASKAVSAICIQARIPVKATGTASANGFVNSANGTAVTSSGSSTVTMKLGEDDIHYNKLVITAGAEKLSSGSPTNTPISPPCKFRCPFRNDSRVLTSIAAATNVGTTPTRSSDADATRAGVGASLAGAIAIVFAILML